MFIPGTFDRELAEPAGRDDLGAAALREPPAHRPAGRVHDRHRAAPLGGAGPDPAADPVPPLHRHGERRPRRRRHARAREHRQLAVGSGAERPNGVTPRVATFCVFAINGAMIGTWVAHIPWLQEQLGVSKATIGLCLLCMAAGALISMPLTGHVLDRRASAHGDARRDARLLPDAAVAAAGDEPVMLGAILFVFGATTARWTSSMNAHGVAVERELSRPIMSSLHGGWSVGGFAAAGIVVDRGRGGSRSARREPRRRRRALARRAVDHGAPRRRVGALRGRGGLALPSRPVLLLGGLCFLVMMTEGAIADWSGIYLRHDAGAEHRRGGAGVHLLLARDGDRAARRRRAQRRASAPACCCAAGWRSSRSCSAPCC